MLYSLLNKSSVVLICIIICLGIYIEKAKLFNLHLFEELVFSTLVFLTSPNPSSLCYLELELFQQIFSSS